MTSCFTSNKWMLSAMEWPPYPWLPEVTKPPKNITMFYVVSYLKILEGICPKCLSDWSVTLNPVSKLWYCWKLPKMVVIKVAKETNEWQMQICHRSLCLTLFINKYRGVQHVLHVTLVKQAHPCMDNVYKCTKQNTLSKLYVNVMKFEIWTLKKSNVFICFSKLYA